MEPEVKRWELYSTFLEEELPSHMAQGMDSGRGEELECHSSYFLHQIRAGRRGREFMSFLPRMGYI